MSDLALKFGRGVQTQRLDLGLLTEDETVRLLGELLDLMNEAAVLAAVEVWIREHELEGELP